MEAFCGDRVKRVVPAYITIAVKKTPSDGVFSAIVDAASQMHVA
jgi:hypothetical protein